MKKLPLIIIITLFMTSCSYVEPNDIAYVVAVGFDKAEESNYDITIQFAKPTQISGGASQEGGKGGDIVENMTVRAPNLYSAINIANNILSKRFSLSHTKLMVFSKDVAKEGLYEMIDTMIRSEELRPDVFLAVADSKAGEYLDSVKPVIEVNPAKYYHLIYEKNDSGGVPKSNLQQFYFEDRTEAECSTLPLAGKVQTGGGQSGASQQGGQSGQGGGSQQGGQSGQDGQSGQSGGQGGEQQQGGDEQKNKANEEAKVNTSPFEHDVANFVAGEVAIKNANKAEAMGMAIFKDGKFIAELGSIESELYNMLTGTLRRSFISFSSSVDEKGVTLRIDQIRRPKYDISIKDKTIKIGLFLESDIYSVPASFSSEDVDKFEQEAEKSIEKACSAFISYCRDKLGADILNFSNVAKRNFWTISKYDEFNFKERFKEFDISVDAELEIRRSGMKILNDQKQ